MFSKQKLNRSSVPRSEGGFSLIEIAIALMVISLIMGGMIQVYNVYAIRKQENDTKNRISTIQSALGKYVENYGKYPRPANRNAPIGTAGFGKEAIIPTIFCTTNTNVACLATGGTVYIGDVPFAALGINYKNTVDSFGSKFTYAVTADLTRFGDYGDAKGLIDVLDRDGNTLYPGITPKAHFIIISPGPDRRGAYSLAGAQILPCGTAAVNGQDFENCNGDATFRSNYETDPDKYEFRRYVRNFTTGTTNFDDVTGYQNTTSSGLWSLTPNVGNLVNTNSGDNILVGEFTVPPIASCTVTSTPEGCITPPQTRLEVKGTVSGTEIWTKRICDAGVNCTAPSLNVTSGMLSPTIIAGSTTALGVVTVPNISGTYNATTLGNAGGGILCPDRNGLNGFYQTTSTGFIDEVCVTSQAVSNVTTLSPADCTSGQYASGITALGVIKCSSP